MPNGPWCLLPGPAESSAAGDDKHGPGREHRGPPTVTSDNVPEGESEVVRHEHIHATDGEIGRLKGFAVDPDDHRVTHVLVRESHLWGRKEVAIPVSAVSSLDDGIWLNVTKTQVEELPPRN
jgi:sporulation protein YlmC with PRC-barrel domain